MILTRRTHDHPILQIKALLFRLLNNDIHIHLRNTGENLGELQIGKACVK